MCSPLKDNIPVALFTKCPSLEYYASLFYHFTCVMLAAHVLEHIAAPHEQMWFAVVCGAIKLMSLVQDNQKYFKTSSRQN